MKFLAYFLIFGFVSQGFSTKDNVFEQERAKAEFEANLGSIEQKDLSPGKLNHISPTIQNPLKTDILGDIVQKAIQENGLKKIDNQNYEKSDDEDTVEHFLNSLEKDLTDDENLKRVQVEESREEGNDRSLWSDEGDFELPKPWKMKNDKKNKFNDESFDDSSISDEDDDYYDEYPEDDEYWFLPYDPEIELDRDAINQAMILGAAKPAKQQSLVIVHETVNIGKIEVNQVPKTLDMPPLADQGLVIIQPDLTQIQGPRSIEHSTEKAERDVSSSEELKRAEIHAHQKQIQAPRFAGSIPDSRESAAKESRKSAEKKHDKSEEMSIEMEHDLEPINAESTNMADFEYKHRFIHFSKTLSIVDFCIIILTIVLLGYMLSLFCQFIQSLCATGPKHINDSKVAPVMEKPLPAKEIKIDMSETN
ncbi:unnamed protein product, partial [Mesorhabditis belari]|uniref:Uncharacterized protein n=1 Tax=Mesorhabditis belari TaxID=2138241 RepID=A0AAF3F069_9BILA